MGRAALNQESLGLYGDNNEPLFVSFNMAFNCDLTSDSIYEIYYKKSKMTIFFFILRFKVRGWSASIGCKW